MTGDLVVVHTTDRVERARELLTNLGLHALPVVEDNVVIGVVSATDLLEDDISDDMIGQYMTQNPVRISPERTLADAAQTMLMQQIHHLIVGTADRTFGILSSFDLLRAFSAPDPETATWPVP